VAPPRSDLGQDTYTWVSRSPSSITWYRPKDTDAPRLEIVFWWEVAKWKPKPPAGWLPRDRDLLRAHRSLIEYWTTWLTYIYSSYNFCTVPEREEIHPHEYVATTLFLTPCLSLILSSTVVTVPYHAYACPYYCPTFTPPHLCLNSI